MVCHETYKDEEGNWLYPDEVEKINNDQFIKKDNKKKIIVGPSESMSKSKKNTVDPEVMISKYGADAVRWFILSDSPPEKDVQWSDTGVLAANRFLQKIWNISLTIINRKEKDINNLDEEKFINEIENVSYKIDNSIETFKLNVAIANFYESYNILNKNLNSNISNKTLIYGIIKIIKLLLPFTPHLANEILDLMKCDTKKEWPSIKKDALDEIKFAVQINGKTKDVIEIIKNMSQAEVEKIIQENIKIKKLLKIKIL